MQHTTGQSTEQPMLQPTDQSTSTMHNFSLCLIVLGGRSHVLTCEDLRMIPPQGDECSRGGTRIQCSERILWPEHKTWLGHELRSNTVATLLGQTTASLPTEGVQLYRKAQPSGLGNLWAPKGANCTSWCTMTNEYQNEIFGIALAVLIARWTITHPNKRSTRRWGNILYFFSMKVASGATVPIHTEKHSSVQYYALGGIVLFMLAGLFAGGMLLTSRKRDALGRVLEPPEIEARATEWEPCILNRRWSYAGAARWYKRRVYARQDGFPVSHWQERPFCIHCATGRWYRSFLK